jgi:hypothetical protein
MNWSPLSLTHYRHGWTPTLKTSSFPLDRWGQQLLAWGLPSRQEKRTNEVLFIIGISSQASYPQPLRSPAPEGRRSGAMDNFRISFE